MEKQTILVTGATGNIGGGAAVSLAKRGARVVLIGRNQARLDKRAHYISEKLLDHHEVCQNVDIDTLVVDFADMDSVKKAAAEALHRYPKIHGLIFSVGTIVQNGPTILPNGHEIMFAVNMLGPFLFTQLLLDRMTQSNGLILHVVNPTHRKIDFKDIESIKNHKTGVAFERTKTMNRIFAGELARRYAGKIASMAFHPSYIIDKNDPELKKRWPKGLMGFGWKILTILIAKPPPVAGEPIADLFLSYADRSVLNGAYFKKGDRIVKSDREMTDVDLGKQLWEDLAKMTDNLNK
jgi:NAD(P)-dependent dehydrogenase (short-subunit alcohol dehydrogenase family)